MSNRFKVNVAVSSGAASAIPGSGEHLGKDTCGRRPHIVAATRRGHALD
jgi:hypothetical protein